MPSLEEMSQLCFHQEKVPPIRGEEYENYLKRIESLPEGPGFTALWAGGFEHGTNVGGGSCSPKIPASFKEVESVSFPSAGRKSEFVRYKVPDGTYLLSHKYETIIISFVNGHMVVELHESQTKS